MALNHDVNEKDHNLVEITDAKNQIAGALAMENNNAGNAPQIGNQGGGQGGGLFSRSENAGASLQAGGGGGHNHASVYGDVAVSKITGGAPSIELVGMGLKILSEGFGVKKAVADGFKGKKTGYGTSGKPKAASIQTGAESKSGMLAFRTAVASDSITSSSKGVQASKAGAPQTAGMKLALQQKLGQALQAEHGVHRQIHQANQMGGAHAPTLTASLKSGPKFKMTDSDLAKVKEENNIWGGSDTA